MSSLVILGIGVGVAYFIYKVTCNLDNRYPEDNPFSEEIKNALYGDGFTEKFIKQKYEIIKKAAECGDADAQLHIGRMYEQGIYLKEDISKAKHWYNLSATKGNAWALLNLGHLSEENNMDVAIEMYKKSMKMGEISAAYNLGVEYRNRARRSHKKGNFSVAEFFLERAIEFLREGLNITKPLYNSSYKEFLKYRYELAVMMVKSLAGVDTINGDREHEEESKKYEIIAQQCEIKMKELYNIDIRSMPRWEI